MDVDADAAHERLVELIETVNDDRIAAHITSDRGNAVLVAEERFAAWQETLYLRSSRANLVRLIESIADAEGERSGVGVQ